MLQNSKVNNKPVKRFYWLKLHHDFFNRDEIRIIESQPNGKDYIIFYLKLMLKSINDNGKLLFKDTIPYTPEMLASITNTSIDTVRVAIDAFVKLGLITLLDDGALYMQEVQKLVGSETPDAERKRIARAKEDLQPKLPRVDKKRTTAGHCPENVTLENKSIELKSKEDITPYNPPSVDLSSNSGIAGVWLNKINSGNFTFTTDELNAIAELADHMAKFESLTDKQIVLNLEIMTDYKKAGYDLIRMIRNSMAKNYRGLMEPTKAFLINGTDTNKPAIVTGRYQSTEYITPETREQKLDLRNYLERCYMRELVDPRTGLALTSEQKALFKAHYDFARSQHISITEYIYQNEVLTDRCLLDQPITGKNNPVIDSVA